MRNSLVFASWEALDRGWALVSVGSRMGRLLGGTRDRCPFGARESKGGIN